jgi:hypothetical protein
VVGVQLHAGAHGCVVLADVEADFAAVFEVEGFGFGVGLKQEREVSQG